VHGYYAEAGLAVDIWSGGPGAGIKLKVAKGDADFGMNRSDDIILAASRGMPLVMVSATLQHDPLALMVHESSPVRSFPDLQGRVVVGNVGLAYFSYLEMKYGLTFEKRQNTYGLGEFLANPEIIQQCVVTSEPFFARQHGKKVRTLLLADSGYDSYHVVFCRRELVRSSPEVVRAFVAATLRGWRDYIEGDPTAVHAEILKRNPQMSPELLAFSRGELIGRGLVRGDPKLGEHVGALSLRRLEREMQILTDLKILEVPVPIAEVATTEFLPRPTP
jgi:NitT/TauT family transport system substrate-binding protein